MWEKQWKVYIRSNSKSLNHNLKGNNFKQCLVWIYIFFLFCIILVLSLLFITKAQNVHYTLECEIVRLFTISVLEHIFMTPYNCSSNIVSDNGVYICHSDYFINKFIKEILITLNRSWRMNFIWFSYSILWCTFYMEAMFIFDYY